MEACPNKESGITCDCSDCAHKYAHQLMCVPIVEGQTQRAHLTMDQGYRNGEHGVMYSHNFGHHYENEIDEAITNKWWTVVEPE
jgi:hypothetical protein